MRNGVEPVVEPLPGERGGSLVDDHPATIHVLHAGTGPVRRRTDRGDAGHSPIRTGQRDRDIAAHRNAARHDTAGAHSVQFVSPVDDAHRVKRRSPEDQPHPRSECCENPCGELAGRFARRPVAVLPGVYAHTDEPCLRETAKGAGAVLLGAAEVRYPEREPAVGFLRKRTQQGYVVHRRSHERALSTSIHIDSPHTKVRHRRRCPSARTTRGTARAPSVSGR